MSNAAAQHGGISYGIQSGTYVCSTGVQVDCAKLTLPDELFQLSRLHLLNLSHNLPLLGTRHGIRSTALTQAPLYKVLSSWLAYMHAMWVWLHLHWFSPLTMSGLLCIPDLSQKLLRLINAVVISLELNTDDIMQAAGLAMRRTRRCSGPELEVSPTSVRAATASVACCIVGCAYLTVHHPTVLFGASPTCMIVQAGSTVRDFVQAFCTRTDRPNASPGAAGAHPKRMGTNGGLS